LAFCLLKKSI